MPVIEYKLIKTREGLAVPDFVKSGGQWKNSQDHTYVGWVDPEPRKYYVPDTIEELDVTEFTNRLLRIHSDTPLIHPDDEEQFANPEPIYMDSDGVEALAFEWYNRYVEENS